MNGIFKLVTWFVVTTLLLSLILLGAETFIPLFGKLINTIEISTNYNITFCDYLISVFGFEIIGVISWALKWFTHLMLND